MRALTVFLPAVTVASVAALSRADEPPRAIPADFKFTLVLYSGANRLISTTEMLCWRGRVFRVISDSSEVVVFDRAASRVDLLDLHRGVRTDITSKKLDETQTKLRKAIAIVIERREKAEGRANRIAAEMSRDLLDLQMRETFDARTRRLELTNSSVEIAVTGEPEPDRARLELLEASLAAFTKLGSHRDVQTIPPFARIEALKRLMIDRHLRPSEMTVTYRLAGPPKKYRWAYHLTDTLKQEEVQALVKVSAVLEQAKAVRFDRYEQEQPKE